MAKEPSGNMSVALTSDYWPSLDVIATNGSEVKEVKAGNRVHAGWTIELPKKEAAGIVNAGIAKIDLASE